MAKLPAERPQSAGGFARQLAAALGGEAQPAPPAAGPTVIEQAAEAGPTVARPASGAAPPRAQRGRGLWLWLGLALVAVCGLGGLALVGGGVGLAALLGSPSATPPRPTATRPAAATAVTTLPAWLAIDDFSDPASGFATRADEAGGVAYEDDVLRFTVLTEGIEWLSPSGRVEAAGVHITVEVQQHFGPERNELAVLCRFQDEYNYVALGISADGHAAIWQKRDGDTDWLLDWTEAPELDLGAEAAHTLAATCAGDTLRLEVDGEVVAEASDPAPAAGDVGLLVGLRAPGELVADFDDLVVTAAE
jgi:hypothetical protein